MYAQAFLGAVGDFAAPTAVGQRHITARLNSIIARVDGDGSAIQIQSQSLVVALIKDPSVRQRHIHRQIVVARVRQCGCIAPRLPCNVEVLRIALAILVVAFLAADRVHHLRLTLTELHLLVLSELSAVIHKIISKEHRRVAFLHAVAAATLGNGDRTARRRCCRRGHADFRATQRADDRDTLSTGQIDITVAIGFLVAADFHAAGHLERAVHKHAAAVHRRIVGDAAAAHVECTVTHKHAAAGASGFAVTGRCVAGDAAAAHIELASGDIHTAAARCVVAGNAAALHVECAASHEHAVAVLSGTVSDGARPLAVGQRKGVVDGDARMFVLELNALAIEVEYHTVSGRPSLRQRHGVGQIVVARRIGQAVCFRPRSKCNVLAAYCMAVRLRRGAKCRRRHALLGQDIPLALPGHSVPLALSSHSAILALPGSSATPVLPGSSAILILFGHSVPLALLCRESVSCAGCPRLLCQRRRRQQRQAQHQRKENTQYFFLHRLVPPVFRVLGSPASRTEKPLPRIRGTTGHAPLWNDLSSTAVGGRKAASKMLAFLPVSCIVVSYTVR